MKKKTLNEKVISLLLSVACVMGTCAQAAGQNMPSDTGHAVSGKTEGVAVSGKIGTGKVRLKDKNPKKTDTAPTQPKEDLNTPQGLEAFLANHFEFKGNAQEQQKLHDMFLAIANTNIGKAVFAELPQTKVSVSVVSALSGQVAGMTYSNGFIGNKTYRIELLGHVVNENKLDLAIHEVNHVVQFSKNMGAREDRCYAVQGEFKQELKAQEEGKVLPEGKRFWILRNDFFDNTAVVYSSANLPQQQPVVSQRNVNMGRGGFFRRVWGR